MKLYSIIQKRAFSGSLRPSKKRKGHRIKTLLASMACFGLALSISAQEEPVDSLEGTKVVLDEVLVQSIRITKDFPITFLIWTRWNWPLETSVRTSLFS